MKKKFAMLLAAVGAFAAFAAPSAAVAETCNDGTSQVRDPETGQVTGEDTLTVLPGTGSTVYGDGAEENLNPGYLGITGSTGYIEISGANDADPNVQIDGASSGGEVEGRVGADTGAATPADACINGNEIL